ncbi:MAG: LamG-like jellyroll fold domain-containing protein [bacterium]
MNAKQKVVMTNSYMLRRRYGSLWIGLAVLAIGTFSALAQAWPEMPTHKTYVFPSYFPKNGQPNYTSSGFQVGFVRERMEGFYEGWWREVSYYMANPTNGLNVNGYYMDTKTVGEIAMPWQWSPGAVQTAESNVVGAVIGTAVAGITNVYTGTLNPVPEAGKSLTIQIGTIYLTDTTGGGQILGAGVGTVNHATGAYSFQLNVAAPPGTPIQAYYTCFLSGSGTSPGAWANFSAPIGDPGSDRYPDGQGEQFDELPDTQSPSVKYRRWDSVNKVLIDDPLQDGFWTPGERFTDMPGSSGLTPPNGRWDPYVHAEDTWIPKHSITGNIMLASAYQALINFITNATVGDVYADYNMGTVCDTNNPARVISTVSMAEPIVDLWIADFVTGSNRLYRVNEMNLFPPDHYEDGVPYYGVYTDFTQADPDGNPLMVTITNNPGAELQGDASHTYVRDVTTPPVNLRPTYTNIPALRRFEYESSPGGRPWVFRADTNLYIEVYTFLQELTIQAIVANPGVVYQGFVDDGSGGIIWVGAGNPWSYVRRNTPIPLPATLAQYRCRIRIPIYYARPLWGAPSAPATYLNPIATAPAPAPYLNPFIDAVGADDQPTAFVPEEPYSDFVSWWDPTGGNGNGIWVPGLYGTPRGTLPPGSTATADYWSYSNYCKYIQNNYPGNTAGLIQRCGDQKYDGPENWAEVDNNQMIQTGSMTTPSTSLGEGLSGWDFLGGIAGATSYETWWQGKFGTTPVLTASIPVMNEWKPPLTDANQVVPSVTVTNMTSTGAVVTVTYGSVTHPPPGTTWTYDSPREFYDMASSLYHNPDLGSSSAIQMRDGTYNFPSSPDANPLACDYGGDLRLGEVTSPWSAAIFGQDRGDCDPSSPDLTPSTSIPSGGPFAYNTHANYGYDAANQLNLEFSTYRTDGQSLTGPRGGHRKPIGYDWHSRTHSSWADAVIYAKDHRDVNLNGLIDQGETVPAGCHNYSTDADPSTPDNGMNTMTLFGWERLVEDNVDTFDAVEDFNSASRFKMARSNTSDVPFMQPSWYAWTEGARSSNTLSTVVGAQIRYADTDGNLAYTPGVDLVWIDGNSSGKFDDTETIIHDRLGTGLMHSGVGPVAARWADVDSNTVYGVGRDLVWIDNQTAGAPGVFDSDVVLQDMTGQLSPGEGAPSIPNNLRTTRHIYVYPTNGTWQLMWAVTNSYAAATVTHSSTNGFELIYTEPGFVWNPDATVLTGRLWNAASEGDVRYVCRTVNDPGYLPGEDVFIDMNHDGLYTADTAISVPFNNLLRVYSGMAASGTISVAYTTNGINTNFHRATSVAWQETTLPGNVRSGETILFKTVPPTNGTPAFGDISAYVKWIDLPGFNQLTPNGTFDPVTTVISGGTDGEYTFGDAVFYDANLNNVYDYGQYVNIPLYMVSLYNASGVASPGVYLAGQKYGTMTRERYISGYNQNQPVSADMPTPSLLTHEQSHDVLKYPDLYDYDRFTTEVINNPVAGGDLMTIPGGMVHGYPDLKFKRNTVGGYWPRLNAVVPQELNYGTTPILRRDGGPQTLFLYPVERNKDQYYVFRNQANPAEYFTLNLNAGDLLGAVNTNNEQPSPYANPIGRGLVIGHSDYSGGAPGFPQQQRSNNRFTWLYVQADGLYDLEDGDAIVGAGDTFGTTARTRQFTAQTEPPAVWFDQTDSGLRIIDIQAPTEPYGPAKVVVEWITPAGSVTSGTEWYSTPKGVDGDADGIPDVWEYYWLGRYTDPLLECNGLTDHDGDGLPDYAEWLAHLNPLDRWSWSIGANTTFTDADVDIDGDGIGNLSEFLLGLNMREPDSDDDNYSDSAELNPNVEKVDITGPGGIRRITSPLYSRSPLVERSVRLTPSSRLIIPAWEINDYYRFMVTNWTVEAWVKLDSSNETGTIVQRVTQQGLVTFELGITNNRPYTTFNGDNSLAYRVEMAGGSAALASNTWYHLAGVFSRSNGSLRLYQDGSYAASMTVLGLPSDGHISGIAGSDVVGTVRLGGGFNGFVDEVRIWGSPRTAAQMAQEYATIINTPWVPGALTLNGVTNVITNLVSSLGNDGSLLCNLRFDDGQNLTVTNKLDGTVHVAGIEDWVHPLGPNEGVYWNRLPTNIYAYGYCVMLKGGATLTTNANDVVPLRLSSLQPSPIDDLNEDNIPDWWQLVYWGTNFNPTVTGPAAPDADPDGDGLTNLDEYQQDTNPLDPFTGGGTVSDGDDDADNDGLSNADELHVFFSNPNMADTDDDGIPDGEEIGVRISTNKLAYGLQNVVSGPTNSLSPSIPRSMVLGLTNNPSGILVPHSERFTFASSVVSGPTVKITAPLNGAQIAVRFTAVQGSVTSATPLNRVRLYNNDLYVADLTLDVNSNFNYTAIIRSGANALTVIAVDTEGGFAMETVNVTGTFLPADIRVTQTWDQPGDLDTWLIDPQGRHMGWTMGGPGYPTDAGSGQRIPGAFLDIDDIPGTGPENITVQRGSATTGVYNVWMNNFANRATPNSTVRVLIKEGQAGEKYVEFGPQAMPVSDANGSNPQAWWHTTDISWPDGTMTPPGTPVSGSSSQTIADEGVGLTANTGWTIEGWIKTGNANQSGAIARYRLDSGVDTLTVGLSNNCPYMMVRGSGGARYELLANALPTNEWVHLAFVYAEGRKAIRIHENGTLVCSLAMLETRNTLRGSMYLDAPLVLGTSTNRFTSAKLDELRFWNLARSGGLIGQNMHVLYVEKASSLIAGYHMDDGGLTVEDMKHINDAKYALKDQLDVRIDAKPGVDGTWGTADDIAAGAGADGQNDAVTATDWAPVYGIRDSDGDGLPDWFVSLYGITEAYGDDDSDGLNNIYEYWCGTSPLVEDTNGNGTTDGEEDFDNDGVNNLGEQAAGTDPRLSDTDDDGITDAMEVRYSTDGADPASPAQQNVLKLDGRSTSYVRAAPDAQQALGTFDISAWVFPTNRPSGNAEIVARDIGGGVYNYCLGIDSNCVPFVRFATATTNVTLAAPVLGALPLNQWGYVRAIFDAASGKFSLYQGSAAVRATVVASVITEKRPLTQAKGPVELRVGRGFAGMMDDVLVKGAAGTLIDYPFDDNTAAPATGISNYVASATYYGSGRQGWAQGGQVQNYMAPTDWNNHWVNAGTFVGGAELFGNFGVSDGELPLLVDSDGDGLADWWEIQFGLNPFSSDSIGDGVNDADRDMSGSGLRNSYIYLMDSDHVIRADPRSVINPATGRLLVGDLAPIYGPTLLNTTNGLTNAEKQQYGLHPLLADTDDDGLTDVAEVRGTASVLPQFTMPNASLSPARSGALKVLGAGYVELPANQTRIALDASWTVEAWINIDPAFSGTGKVIQRAIGTAVNYELGLTNGLPYVRLAGVYSGNLYNRIATGPVALTRRNQWYHLAGTYDATTRELKLLVDGSVAAVTAVDATPSMAYGTGTVVARVGEGFYGLLDEVRIWDLAQTSTNLAFGAYQTFENLASGPVLCYRFDDGPFGVSSTTTTNQLGLAINRVEDFAAPAGDWMLNWAHAGKLAGDATLVITNSPLPATQFVDQDVDDLPDFWEIAAFGSISVSNGSSDSDGDGLDNYNEYRARLNPLADCTFGGTLSDFDRDSDGDGLPNGMEQSLGTLPDMVDTDDDGSEDGAEVAGVNKSLTRVGSSDPLNSLNPVVNRALAVNGNSRVVVPAQGRHAMNSEFTLAAWMWPSNGADGIILARTLADGTVNYELGLANRAGILRPYVRYTALTNGQPRDIRVEANVAGVTTLNSSTAFDAVAPQTWTHVAASYQAASNTLKLFVAGELVAWRTDANVPPVTGAGANLPLGGELTIGGGRLNVNGVGVASGFEGYIDEVRIAAKAYSGDAIRQMAGAQMVIVSNAAATNASARAAVQRVGSGSPVPASYHPAELIVGLQKSADVAVMLNVLGQSGVSVIKGYSIIPALHVQITDGTAADAKIATLKADKRIAYVEPNYALQYFDTTPNDTRFGQQWGLSNLGTNGPGGGVTGADIDALKAWDVGTGKKSVIVAVIDSGVDYNHPDLKNNMWRNPGEIAGNGIDDDGNGYVDDVYGYDFGAGDADPMDDVVGHGTHVAGIIGATGNDATGVSGVNWNVQIMALKFADNNGGLSLAAAIEAIEYAWKMGARVSNNSWGGYQYAQSLYDAIKTAGENDHLFCAAAANDSNDNDQSPAYPASYDLDNIIAVAATDNRDALASFSNYGLTTVDLGAPGVEIMSTLPLNGSDMGATYGYASGTSMATPYVAGVAGLVLSVDNTLGAAALKAAILNNVDPDPALVGKTVTGGRLNVGNILPKMGGGGGGGAVVVNGLAGWFRFDDGGNTAQDFTLTADWRRDWRYAGQLAAGAAMTTNNPYLPTGDSDADGLPDWWEEANGLSPYDATGDNGGSGDPDGDGLINLYEYLAHTDPHQADTGNTGTTDYNKDSDNDYISNGAEQDYYLTDPGNKDTDDDAIQDNTELTSGTDPIDSLSPFVDRALEFRGGAGSTVVVYDKVNNKFTSRHSMSEWTVEAYVNPSTISTGACPLVSRTVLATGRRNYELGMFNGVPYVAFDAKDSGIPVMLALSNNQAMTTNRWTHLAGRLTIGRNGQDNELALFVDGIQVVTMHIGWQSETGPGDLLLGSPGFTGMLSDIRLWKIARDDQAIADARQHKLVFGNSDNSAGRLLLSGTGYLKETATAVGGGADYIDMLRNNWTLECWVRTTSAGVSLIERRNQSAATADNFNYYLGISPGGTLLGRFAIDYTYLVGAPPAAVYERNFVLNDMLGDIPVNDGQWHHVAYVRADNGCYLYVDGLLDSSQSRIIVDPTIPSISYVIPPAVFAEPGPCIFGEGMTGEMDEIRIWNRALPVSELLNVSSHNLTGNERGLVTYFNFDFQIGETADERSVLRDNTSEYGIFIPSAINLRGSGGGAPISYNPLLAIQRVALVGLFLCNDGGITVEDYVYPMGVAPFNFSAYAGWRGTNVAWRELTILTQQPYRTDSDGDGLPDWWEVWYDLSPSEATGENGPWGDPDHDGLYNAAEYLAGTDPRNPDSLGAGYLDYDNRRNTISLTFGELYTPMDSMPARWKVDYGLNPNKYMAEDDSDLDGWSNYAEYMAGTDPKASGYVPRPRVEATIWYAGTPVAGDIKIESYTTPLMDGMPDAIMTMATVDAATIYPQTFAMSAATNVTRWIREGNNWFFAYLDKNGNSMWDTDEPCGTALYQPVTVGWSAIALDINLQDTPLGFPRIKWALPSTGVEVSRVQVDYVYENGATTNYSNVADLVLRAPRNYLTEADLVNLGKTTGMGTPGQTSVWQPKYRWSVMFDPSGPTPVTYAKQTPYGVFTQVWTMASFAKPVILSPSNETVRTLPLQFEWTAGDNVAAFKLEILKDSTSGTVVAAPVVRAPFSYDNGGAAHYFYAPQYAGGQFLSLPDGVYYWRVTPNNSPTLNGTTASEWSRIVVDTTGSYLPTNSTMEVTGPFSISGELEYFGKVANHALDERILVGVGGTTRVFTNSKLSNSVVTAGSMTLRLYRSGSASNLVTFTDVGANTSNLASVTLVVDPLRSTAGWLSSTCVVNYVSGSILSLTFQAVPGTNDTFLGIYDYQGYPFIVQAYPLLDVPGFSGRPVAQVSMWKKGPFKLTGLPPASYVLLGFVDQYGDGRLRSPEAWGFVRNQVPDTAPGYPEIKALTVGPSVLASSGVKVMMRDRDTDNDKLPDSWELQKFGSIGAYSGEQVLNGKTIWAAYADGPLDASPYAWDSDYDGLPDAVELAFGFNTHSPSSLGNGLADLEAYLGGNQPFAIPTMTTDGAGYPKLEWNSPAVVSGTQIRYTVLRTLDLSSWPSTGVEVLALPGDAAQVRSFVDASAPAGAFYKLNAVVEKANTGIEYAP